MLHSKDFTGFSHIVYNDGREGHTEVKAEILELHENFMLVQFEDRADTTTIYYSDADWMNYIKPVSVDVTVSPELVRKLSSIFTKSIWQELSNNELERVRELNKLEPETDICHTHDFIDSNVCMITAFKQATGIELDPQNDSHAKLVNGAWNLSKESDFKL